jgi:transcriptional regulator GlxA family with amidase domain
MADSHNTSKTSVPSSYGLLLFPQFEVLDAAGPIELLNAFSNYFDHQEIHLSVIAPSKELVSPAPLDWKSSNRHFLGAQLYQPTHSIEDAPPLDVLIVPGGRGTARSDEELKDLLEFLRKSFKGSDGRPPLKYIFSICTGSDLLARAGILDGQKATTNKKAWSRVTPHGPKTHWIAQARWVESGKVWTTSGVTAGMDGMAALIGRIYGEDEAQQLCNFIEHRRVEDPNNDPFADMNGCKDVLPA